MKNKNIVMIGGGTGSFVVLSGLKKYPIGLSAVVSVTDSGGSTGRLRTEFGFLPVGDMRQCLAAMAAKNGKNYIRKLLLYRFNKGGGLKGHNLGNLILTALTDLTDSEAKALEKAADIFKLGGNIYPITTRDVQLVAEYEDGSVVLGEHEIDEPNFKGGRKIIKLYLRPGAGIYKGAKKALMEADLIVLGPGDLYTSILPNLVVRGLKSTIKKSGAKLLYIVNLMTRYSQTDGYSAKDHLKEVEKYLGSKLDYILVNNGKIDKKIIELYEKEKGYPVEDDLGQKDDRVIRKNLLAPTIWTKPKGDDLQRSYLRHSSDKLAKEITKLL